MTREGMHIKALSKAIDSNSLKQSMTVVLLGYTVDMMMEMQDAHEAELKAKDERIQTQKDAISFLENTVKEKIARIAELEAKIKPKSCDGCKYEEDKRSGNCYAFSSCSRDSFDHYTPKERG
jgi:septal ring factor EnvC (AmiA/AmiB activator)